MKTRYHAHVLNLPILHVLLVSALPLGGCYSDQEQIQPLGEKGPLAHSFATGSGWNGTTQLHPLGGKPETEETVKVRLRMQPSSLTAQALTRAPPGVNMSRQLPPPGNQGPLESCAGWAAAYAAKSYQEQVEMNWSIYSMDHVFSPSWLWNQNNGGGNNGAFMSDVLNTIINIGADSWAGFPGSTTDFTTQPDSVSTARASHFKASSWYMTAASTSNLQALLANGTIVILGLEAFLDLHNLNSTDNTIYDSTAGKSTGYHFVALIGYDSALQAFKFINSWGTGWGSGGYGWLAYSLLSDPAMNLQASVLVDKANTYPLPMERAAIWAVSSGGRILN